MPFRSQHAHHLQRAGMASLTWRPGATQARSIDASSRGSMVDCTSKENQLEVAALPNEIPSDYSTIPFRQYGNERRDFTVVTALSHPCPSLWKLLKRSTTPPMRTRGRNL